MHVLLLTSWYKHPKSKIGGSFFEEQARALMSRGHSVGIIWPKFASFSGTTNKIDRPFFEHDNGIPTYFISYKSLVPRSRKMNYYLYCRKVYKAFKTYVSENGTPDVIHAHTVFYAGIAAKYISQKTGIPYVITEHYTSFITGGVNDPFDLEISKEIYENSKSSILVSNGFKKLLSQKLKVSADKFEVVPNMVSSIFFESSRIKHFSADLPVFFTMSFLTERKNHKLMLDSFKLFLEEFPLAQFKIGGNGSIRSDLENYVAKLGISENVLFLGSLDRHQVVSEMNSCDVFLLASTFETFGVVLIEALATGIPVISTDSVGPRDIITDNNGIITNDFEVQTFKDAMKSVVESYDKYVSEEIVKDCQDRFSEEAVIQNLETIYSRAIS